jgi:hypothetical protein
MTSKKSQSENLMLVQSLRELQHSHRKLMSMFASYGAQIGMVN